MAGINTLGGYGLPDSVRKMLGLDDAAQPPAPTPAPDASSTGDINANGVMLPGALRSLGIGAPPAAPVLGPAQQPSSVMDAMAAAAPVLGAPPVQNGPDFAVPAPNVPGDIAGVKRANAAYDRRQAKAQQQAYAESQRMPTLADTVHAQQGITQQQLDAAQQTANVEAAKANDTADEIAKGQAEVAAFRKQQQDFNERSDKEYQLAKMRADGLMHEADATKIDSGRYWHDAGTGKKVGWAIAMALSGLGDALQHKSGPNPVIEMLQKTIDSDVRMQLDARELKYKAAGHAQDAADAITRFSKDRNARYEALMAASEKYAAQQVAIVGAKYAAPEAQARAAEISGKLLESANDRMQKAIEMHHTMWVQDEGVKNARAQVGLGYAQLKQRKDEFLWSKEKEQQQLDLEAAKLAAKGDPARAEAVQKYGVAGVMSQKVDAAGKPVFDADGKPVLEPFVAQGTPEAVEKVRERTIAAKTIVGLMDEAMRVRTGWTSDAGKSPEWQKLQTLWAANKGVAKNLLQLGALSESDYDLLNDFLGTDDPTRGLRYDPTPGIKQARKNIVAMTNKDLQGHGLIGEFDIPDFTNKGAVEMPGDVEAKDVLGVSMRTDPGRIAADLGVPRVDPQDPRSYEIRVADAYHQAGGLTGYQRQILDGYVEWLRSDDPKLRERGAANLEASANSADAPGVRAYAQQLLTNNIERGIASPSEVTDPNAGRAVARDTLSQPPRRGSKR